MVPTGFEFTAPTNYAATPGYVNVSSGNFDSDNLPDLVIGSSSDGQLAIRPGLPGGTFGAATSFPSGRSWVFRTAPADLNNDGKLDLAVAHHAAGDISVLFGNGDRTFQLPQTYTTGSYTHDVVAVDFDGDSDIDLIASNYFSETISVLTNQGNGDFDPAVSYYVGLGAFDLAIGDFDDVNGLDVAVTIYNSNQVVILRRQADGSLAAPIQLTTGATPAGLGTADFDGDGDLDLAVANSNANTVSIFLNQGGGVFAANSVVVGNGPRRLSLTDMNADGRPDLAVACYTDSVVSVLGGDGVGSFGAPQTFPTSVRPFTVEARDLNDDGSPDLAIGAETGVSILLNQTGNQRPVLAAIRSLPGQVGQDVTFTASASDLDLSQGDALTFSLVGAPEDASIDAVTGVFHWTPTAAQTGIYTFVVRVTDTGNLFDEETVTLAVNQAARFMVVTGEVVPFGDPNVDGPVLRWELDGTGLATPLAEISNEDLYFPVGLAFGPTGDLFVGNRTNLTGDDGSISRFTFNASGNATFHSLITGNDLDTVHFLAFSPTGELFAVNYPQGNNLPCNPPEAPGSGGIVSRFTFDALGNPVPNGSFSVPHLSLGIAFAPDGELFITAMGTVYRYRFDVAGNAVPSGTIPVPGAAALHDLEFSPWAELFIPDTNTGQVYRYYFDANRTAIPNGSINVGGVPIGIAFTSENELLVSRHNSDGDIFRYLFDAQGNAISHGLIDTPQSLAAVAVRGSALNQLPTADAGGPYSILEGGSLTLDGSNSSDPDDPLTYHWYVNGSDAFPGFTDVSPTLDWATLNSLGIVDGHDSSSFNVRLVVTGGALSDEAETTVSVENEDPTPSIATISTPRIEGTAITASGSATDPAGTNDTLSFSWAVEKNGAPYASGSGTSITFIPDDNGSYRIFFTAADEDGGSSWIDQTITVDNDEPNITNLSGPGSGLRGQALTFSASFTDDGLLDSHSAMFDWGDGTTSAGTITGSPGAWSVSASHVYAATGNYIVTLTVLDDDGGSDDEQTAVSIVAVVLEPCPDAPSETQLVIAGTLGPDTIRMQRGPTRTSVVVFVNSVNLGTYTPTCRIIAHGWAGNDVFDLAANVALPAQLHGEEGDDIYLGWGDTFEDDLLQGGPGYDRITNPGQGGALTLAAFGPGNSIEEIVGRSGRSGQPIAGNASDNVLDFSSTILSLIAYIDGGAGNDRLVGNAADNDLRGGRGNDTLVGSLGNDVLTGGQGDDLFVMDPADATGEDTILDLRDGSDRIDLRAFYTDWAFIAANSSTDGRDMVITLPNGKKIRLDGFRLSRLDATDFLF